MPAKTLTSIRRVPVRRAPRPPYPATRANARRRHVVGTEHVVQIVALLVVIVLAGHLRVPVEVAGVSGGHPDGDDVVDLGFAGPQAPIVVKPGVVRREPARVEPAV